MARRGEPGDGSGRQALLAAAIVGLAVIVGSAVLARSLDRVARQIESAGGRLDQIRSAVVDAKDALSKLQVAGAAPARGPDPNRRYTVNTQGSPALGPQTAAITVVEFSDFQ